MSTTGVFSTPLHPLPMETELDDVLQQFFNDFPAVQPMQMTTMSMDQPPELPEFDNPKRWEFSAGQVVKQEQQSGFLDTWAGNQQPADAADYSPEEQKQLSQLVKEELSCRIQLKMMKEGKQFGSEEDSQPATKDYSISEETRQLQMTRREKNREAAKKCRQKKKATEREQEQRIREAEKSIRELQQQLQQSRQEYSGVLSSFLNFPCFVVYLRQNRHLLRQPQMKSVLQAFVKTHGCHLSQKQCAVHPNEQMPGFIAEQ